MHRFASIVLFTTAMLVFGCGGSKNPSSPIDPQGAATAAAAGDAALASGDIQGANDHYRRAVQLDPGNAQANVGLAITELYLLQNDSEVSALWTQINPPPLPLRAPGGARTLSRATLMRSLGYGDPAFTPIANATMVGRWMLSGTEDPLRLSDVQRVIRTKVLPKLQYAEELLNRVEMHPDWRYLVPPSVTEAPDTIEVDLGEIYAIDAVLNNVQGWLGILIAYNFDGIESETARPESLLAPGTDFATLHPDGAAQLTAARANLMLSKQRLESAIAFIGAETDPQEDDVIPAAALTEPGFVQFMQGFDQVCLSMTGPEAVPVEVDGYTGSPMTIHILIKNFFTDPIDDWKVKMPEHTFVEGEPRISDPISFPDPTFNGIFPSMTNETWYQLIGPVNPPPVAARP